MRTRLFATAILSAVLMSMTGCANNPVGEVALESSVRIAVRHSLANSDRAIEKARNIRAIAERVQAAVAEDWTVATINDELDKEIDKLGLDPLSREDAKDLQMILAALLEQRLGSGELKPDGVVKVKEFTDLVLAALPAV